MTSVGIHNACYWHPYLCGMLRWYHEVPLQQMIVLRPTLGCMQGCQRRPLHSTMHIQEYSLLSGPVKLKCSVSSRSMQRRDSYALHVQFFGGSSARGGGFESAFGSAFGGSRGGRTRAQQGEDEKYELKLDFLDAVFGAK